MNHVKKFNSMLLIMVVLMAQIAVIEPVHTYAAENTGQATLFVEGKQDIIIEESSYDIKENTTALSLLQEAAEDVELEETDFGPMIVSINGVKAESPNFWGVYVNGQMAEVGAHKYKVSDGEQITFRYQSSKKKEQSSRNIASTESLTKKELQKSINQVSKYILNQKVGEWGAVALKKSGNQLPDSYLKNVKQTIKNKNGQLKSITDYEKYTLGILAAGGDPTSVAGHNIVKKVYNGDLKKQGLNGVIYGLVALSSANFDIPEDAKWTEEKIVDHLLNQQNENGSWAAFSSGADITAMAITALSEHNESPEVKKAIESAITYLEKHMSRVNNSSSAAQVIIGLTANGFDPASSRFNKTNGTNLVSYLLTFQNEDGGFGWKDGDKSNAFSSNQPFMALVAYHLFINNEGALYDFEIAASDVKDQNEQTKSHKEENNTQKESGVRPVLLIVGIAVVFVCVVFYIIMRRKKA